MNKERVTEFLYQAIKLPVADTFWSVHIKCCFQQKKTRLKAETEVIERQHKSCEQSKSNEKRDKQTIMLSQCC